MREIKCWAPAAALFAVDRLTKIWAENTLSAAGWAQALPGLFCFRYVRNTGAAFSMMAGGGWVLTAATALLALGVIALWIFDRRLPALARWSLPLIALGGLGNLWDRLVYGYVIDFIEPLFVRFAVFNVADMMICVGAALFALSLLLQGKREGGERG